ncbi:VOC family protein [Congregibacter sp.]|jgi:predicted enzyme related to lactoylglutathione lyase|uniref:VOC family protein n=1 Tax=Congregibacter sp. TaxID=2744308 RepID=UPI0039E3B0BB
MLINQITIGCTDYAESVAFYKAIGLVQIVDAPPRYARFESPSGDGATLSLHSVDKNIAQNTVVYFDHTSEEALASQIDKLIASGLVLRQKITDESWGWKEARIMDPAGNELCFMFAGDQRRFPRWRVDGRSP